MAQSQLHLGRRFNCMKKINFKNKFKKFSDQWSPKVIAELNDYQFKLVKIQNDFIWHQHNDTDEVFIVIKGKMFIEFETELIELNEGEMIVVPKEEASIMLVEPRGVLNTGDKVDELTAPNDQWI